METEEFALHIRWDEPEHVPDHVQDHIVGCHTEIKRLRCNEVVLSNQLAAAQAQIDRLMLEYCPDEMTRAQMDNYAVNQVVVTDAVVRVVEKSLE